MQDYTPFFLYPKVPTAATSHAEHITLASIRYRIHEQIAKLETTDALNDVLTFVRDKVEDAKAG